MIDTRESLIARLEQEARLWEPSPLTNLLREAIAELAGDATAAIAPLNEAVGIAQRSRFFVVKPETP